MTSAVNVQKAPEGVNWRTMARCLVDTSCPDFFTSNTEERYVCRAVCHACPVRWDCLQSALDNHDIVGVWGGVDDYEIRRALSVNVKGEPVERSHKPRCPYCKNRKLAIGRKTRRGTPVSCPDCGMSWWIAPVKRQRKAREVEDIDDELDDGVPTGDESEDA